MTFISKLVSRAVISSRSIYTTSAFKGDEKILTNLKKLQSDIFMGRSLIANRSIHTTRVCYDDRTLKKLRKLQAEYQREDGNPIWLKAGLRDRILYSTTILCCAIGVINVILTCCELAAPPSWQVGVKC